MKKKNFRFMCIFPIALLGVLFYSCNADTDLISSEGTQQSYVPKPIELPCHSLEWDVSYHPFTPEWITRADVNHSNEMAVTSDNVFVGAVYTAQSIEDLTYSWIPNTVKPIDVAFTFPRYYFDNILHPSVTGMYRSLSKAIESPYFIGKQSLSFEYNYKEFSYYRELKLAFGANVNILGLFKLDASLSNQKIKSKSGLFARVVQKNFSVIMDYPIGGNIFQNENDLKAVASKNPVYVNSIIFGRMAIIAIESNYEYHELKAAFQAALTAGKVGVELDISAEYKKILQDAQMKLMVSGGDNQQVAKILEGYNEFKNFIIEGGEFTKEVPGVPIFFTANYAQDNSVFNTSFIVTP